MTTDAEDLFWQLATELQRENPRVCESTIMNGRCLRVGKEFSRPRRLQGLRARGEAPE